MCCKLGAINEVEKEDGQWCKHCSTHQSCDAYDQRPKVCRDYFCYYMLSELGEEWRPSTAKLMISTMMNGLVYISVDPDHPHVWRNEPYYSTMRQWALNNRIVVLLGPQVWAVYPDRVEDLGRMEEGHFLAPVDMPSPNGILKRVIKIRREDLPEGHPDRIAS